MNKKLKRILSTISAIAMCAVSVVSVSAVAIAVFNDRAVTPDTTSFSATIYGETYKLHLWQEATDYFDDENVKIYISDKFVNDYGEEYTYQFISNHMAYYDTISDKWEDYCSVGLVGFGSYFFDTKEDTATFEKYLSDNNIAYKKSGFVSGNGAEITIECYTETSDGEFEPIYTDDEYFELLQKIKEDTGFITSWISPETMIEVTDAENALPEPTLIGDANEDGKVSLADAVLIMQALSNPDEYKLTPQGMANADIAGDGDGVTAMDALRIQEIELGI